MEQEQKKALSKRKAREGAFFVIFQKAFSPELTYDTAAALAELSDLYEIDDFSRSLVEPVFENLSAVDDAISSCLIGWSFDRISSVSKAVLRLGAGELAYSEINKRIVFNECVELAKKYAGQRDASFVNGVLASVEKIVRKQ